MLQKVTAGGGAQTSRMSGFSSQQDYRSFDARVTFFVFDQQRNLVRRFGISKIKLSPSPSGLGCCPFYGGGSVAVNSLLLQLWGSMFFHLLLCITIILMKKRESWLLYFVMGFGLFCLGFVHKRSNILRKV